jgi:hypothetical protein
LGFVKPFFIGSVLFMNAYGYLDAIVRFPSVPQLESYFCVKLFLCVIGKTVAYAVGFIGIPNWPLLFLSALFLNVWLLPVLYVLAIRPQERTVEGPLAVGAGVYGSCAGCHGANGAGGAGRVLYQGEVLKTFLKIEDMLNFVYAGSQQYVSAGLKIYGNPDREGGAHALLSYNGNPMPQQGEKYGGGLTEAEILGVVCHERYELSGADPESEEWKAEYELWCSPESEIFAGLETGAVNFDNLAETYAAMPNAPAHVGTDPRPSGK